MIKFTNRMRRKTSEQDKERVGHTETDQDSPGSIRADQDPFGHGTDQGRTVETLVPAGNKRVLIKSSSCLTKVLWLWIRVWTF